MPSRRACSSRHAFLLALAIAAGCGGKSGPSDAGVDAGYQTPRLPEATRATSRDACEFARGSKPRDTIGAEYPVGTDIPIDHFILLMLENRSFDHYFGKLPGVDGLPANATNPDAVGTPVASYHETAYCIDDTAHSWDSAHRQYNGGAMDGFVVTNDPGGNRTMGYFDETDLPFYYGLYSTFAISDRHFCSALSSTWTNRWYFTGASSFGRTSNDMLPSGFFETSFGTEPYNIYMSLDAAGIEWRDYYTDAPWPFVGFNEYVSGVFGTNFAPIESFYSDLAAGALPPVTWIEPSYLKGVEETDEHPPSNPQFGQEFVAQLVDAIMHSPIWSRTALIITYDEHGGLYDHVAPPSACVPDRFPAAQSDGTPRADTYDRLGFRVPLVVVSPYAKRGYVSHQVSDHTSVLRLLEARFDLPALSNRDANAWPLLDMFDFENPPFVTPPSLPVPTIDETKVTACHTAFPSPAAGVMTGP